MGSDSSIRTAAWLTLLKDVRSAHTHPSLRDAKMASFKCGLRITETESKKHPELCLYFVNTCRFSGLYYHLSYIYWEHQASYSHK